MGENDEEKLGEDSSAKRVEALRFTLGTALDEEDGAVEERRCG